MSAAFHGDPAVKAGLLDRIDRAVVDGAIKVGPTFWSPDERHGSPLGLSIADIDPARYADRFGYPLPLATLLDPLTAAMGDTPDTWRFVRDWVAVVAPGAALDTVSTRLLLFMLDAIEVRPRGETIGDRLSALHMADLTGQPATGRAWAEVRAALVAVDRASLPRRHIAWLDLCEAAAWSGRNGRSVLVETLRNWLGLANLESHPAWSDEDDARKDTVLARLWSESEPAREAGEQIDFPSLFAATDPELEAAYCAHLVRSNARLPLRANELAAACRQMLIEASTHVPTDLAAQ